MFQIPKVKLRHKKVKRRTRDKIPNSNDFTISESADALVAPTRIKKFATSQAAPIPTVTNNDEDLSWEAIFDENLDININENDDGVCTISCQGKNTGPMPENQQNVYPEIVWYLISKHVAPEDVCRFALINKSAYACTQQVYFWHSLYKRYCKNVLLPEKYKLENCFKKYGLRQRVVRALFHTYKVFRHRITVNEERPHILVNRKCINAWQSKGASNCYYYLKLKKICPLRRSPAQIKCNIFEELGRVDANPEDGCKVLQVTSKTSSPLPFLIGLTLSNVNVFQSENYAYQKLHLGFNHGIAVSNRLVPECMVILDSIAHIAVYDWWHPKYPNFDNTLPVTFFDEELPPVLKTDFFNM